MPAAVTRTYLEMASPEELRGTEAKPPSTRVERMQACPPSFFRYLYAEVGRSYHWVDRLLWSDAQAKAHLADPTVTIHLLTDAGAPAGYFELKRHPDGSVEIAYLGLLPEFVGRGLGRYLLCSAVREAWTQGPNRVWLHTCSLDGVAALPNYLARGFRPYRTELLEAMTRA